MGFNEEHISKKGLPSARLKVSYAGNLSIKYIDWELLRYIISNYPGIDFYFAGPGIENPEFRQITTYQNVFYVGKLEAKELPIFYSNADILLIAYKYDEYPKQLSNPHKVMEYLASGKMIIASWTDHYTDLFSKEVILMAKTTEAFKDHFKRVIENIDKWNSKEKTITRKNYAQNNTYDLQIDRIETLMHHTTYLG
jgi:glycosyltransferase involved in cell wall biosynthesis